MKEPLPILYSFRRCPYAMRARMALSVTDQTCLLREVVLRDKPAEMLDASPKGTVPVMVFSNGWGLDESIDIMRWALAINDPESWLTPETGTLDDMLALIKENDFPFKEHLDKYKYTARYEGEDSEHHRMEGGKFLAKLDAMIGEGGFLFGTRRSLADVAIFPFVRQFANADRGWFDDQPLAALQAWLDDHLNWELFNGIMKKLPQWQVGDAEPVFPFKTAV